MVVVWKHADVVNVLIERGAEPDVFADDLRGLLNDVAAVLFVFTEPPAGVPS